MRRAPQYPQHGSGPQLLSLVAITYRYEELLEICSMVKSAHWNCGSGALIDTGEFLEQRAERAAQLATLEPQ